jgi:hypothetical protein
MRTNSVWADENRLISRNSKRKRVLCNTFDLNKYRYCQRKDGIMRFEDRKAEITKLSLPKKR